jgi:hypothetical protein
MVVVSVYGVSYGVDASWSVSVGEGSQKQAEEQSSKNSDSAHISILM